MPDNASLDLEEAFFETDQVRWKRLFPWLRLGEVIRLSLDPRKVVLATFGVAIYIGAISLAENLPFFVSGDRALDLLVPMTQPATAGSLKAVQPVELLQDIGAGRERLIDMLLLGFGDPIVGRPLVATLSADSIAGTAESITRLLIGLLIWSLFGGAIARITALQFAGDHPTSMISSLRFSAQNIIASFVGPLLPFFVVVFLWLLLAVGGAIGAVPAVGGAIAGMFWGLSLLFGFTAVLLLIGMALSWPIMIAGTAVEATDSFDSLSRGFNYLFARPIYIIFLALGSVFLGVLLTSIIDFFAIATEVVTTKFFGTFSDAAIAAMRSDSGLSHNAWFFWMTAFRFAVAAFPIAYFWTAATIVYFLMRLSIDAMPLDRIYIPESSEVDDLAPLVGIAATDRREKQRAETSESDTVSISTADAGELGEEDQTTPEEADE